MARNFAEAMETFRASKRDASDTTTTVKALEALKLGTGNTGGRGANARTSGVGGRGTRALTELRNHLQQVPQSELDRLSTYNKLRYRAELTQITPQAQSSSPSQQLQTGGLVGAARSPLGGQNNFSGETLAAQSYHSANSDQTLPNR